jgi:glycerophosphoryl diester phosphodiesterase
VTARVSFKAGADVVEFDVHPTTDGHFAVFHDWTLNCRTNGKGVTREHSLPALKALDIGYGYTADGGETFPFRGKGVGLMPSMDEVLKAFPGKTFLINLMSRDRSEGEKLAAALARLPREQRTRLMVYGGDEPIAEVKRRLPEVRTTSRGSLRSCLILYIVQSWSGVVPAACRNSMVLVPINVAPWLWGWPNRFVARMAAVNSRVFLLGPYNGGEFSTGIDSDDDLRRIPEGYAGGIWTNEIEDIGRALRRRNGVQP